MAGNSYDQHYLAQKTLSLRRENPGKAYQSLKRRKLEIVDAWEQWIKDDLQLDTALEMTLRKSLEAWMEQLIQTLDPANIDRSIDFSNRIDQQGGFNRAMTPGYSLPRLLKEYSLLRKAIVMILEEDTALELSEREIINEAVDTALSLAADEFAKRQREQTENALREAERSNRDLEHFAAIAAHDLKSPLATITGYLDLLKDEVTSENSLSLLEVSIGNAKRMLALIDRLLEYATVSAKKPEFIVVDLDKVMDAVVANLKDTIEKRSAEIHREKLPVIKGDFSLLIQLFQNLIANAIKFNHRDRPEVFIRCDRSEGNWTISVRDNGVGFEQKEEKAIFEPYSRLNRSEFEGSGLGLATVQRVVALHHGSIAVSSTPGEGSTFTIKLPV